MLQKKTQTIILVLELTQPGEPICFQAQQNRLFFLGNILGSLTLEPS